MKRFFLFFLMLIFAGMILSGSAAMAGPQRTIDGHVTRVSDGDTVNIVTADGTKLRIRLCGADAPEVSHPGKPGQPYGEEAGRALANKVQGQNITLQVMDIDRYKRVVAILVLDGRDINLEMVREGWAWAYRQYLDRPHSSGYIQAEELARKERRGLWRQSNPQPPWEFRRGLRERW
jgi:micrococcal nuclease